MLTASQIAALSAFGDRPSRLWADIDELARRVHAAPDAELGIEFHHLLLAVVNFKANLKVYPPAIRRGEPPTGTIRRDCLLVAFDAGPSIPLGSEDSASWRSLAAAVPGLAVPRTSTLLAALWPQRHAIIDRRALSAACALIGSARGWAATPVRDGAVSTPVKTTWANYDWYRAVVLEESSSLGVPPVDVERALYRLALRIESLADRSWADYAQRFHAVLAALD